MKFEVNEQKRDKGLNEIIKSYLNNLVPKIERDVKMYQEWLDNNKTGNISKYKEIYVGNITRDFIRDTSIKMDWIWGIVSPESKNAGSSQISNFFKHYIFQIKDYNPKTLEATKK